MTTATRLGSELKPGAKKVKIFVAPGLECGIMGVSAKQHNTHHPMSNTTDNALRRYLVYRTGKSTNHLCVAAARDAKHALQIARQMFILPRDAHAVLEARGRQLRLF
jgi:hypothetical protein